jgi:hypothetical protein
MNSSELISELAEKGLKTVKREQNSYQSLLKGRELLRGIHVEVVSVGNVADVVYVS